MNCDIYIDGDRIVIDFQAMFLPDFVNMTVYIFIHDALRYSNWLILAA